ncbi:uncharacterized protein LOC126291464 [Schistocerca gregaria]|uniref:uncharacterized protein LOC126291464 n=1 Tax=Schistocerca gregaria TaxID=7010 RepID=UPI00211EAC53|nr:uncharacterized protein LOC126291464 [Schistocerca gregaria]
MGEKDFSSSAPYRLLPHLFPTGKYGAAAWADRTKHRYVKRIIDAIQRPFLLQMIRAFRTIGRCPASINRMHAARTGDSEGSLAQKTYAAAAATPTQSKRTVTVKETIKQNVEKAVPTVFIKPKKGDDVKTAKEKFEKSINPRVDKIKINQQFVEQFKVHFKAGPRDRNTVHYAIEVAPTLIKQIITTNRLYVGYNAISVKDYTALAKCSKCQDYGHVAKYCNFQNPVCGNCGSKNTT